MLRMILEHTLDTMIPNTLKDGCSRRLGDYFMLQMEVCGRFDSPDDQFDASRHKLALKLRPLKAMKRKPGRGENLFVLEYVDVEVSDNIVVAYCTQHMVKPFYSSISGCMPGTVSDDVRCGKVSGMRLASWRFQIGEQDSMSY